MQFYLIKKFNQTILFLWNKLYIYIYLYNFHFLLYFFFYIYFIYKFNNYIIFLEYNRNYHLFDSFSVNVINQFNITNAEWSSMIACIKQNKYNLHQNPVFLKIQEDFFIKKSIQNKEDALEAIRELEQLIHKISALLPLNQETIDEILLSTGPLLEDLPGFSSRYSVPYLVIIFADSPDFLLDLFHNPSLIYKPENLVSLQEEIIQRQFSIGSLVAKQIVLNLRHLYHI